MTRSQLDEARSSAEGLLTAVVFNCRDTVQAAVPGLWQAYESLAYTDDQTVKDVGHLLGLYALLQAPEVLTQALQQAATQLAALAGLGDAFKAVAGLEAAEVEEHAPPAGLSGRPTLQEQRP
ncbi:MAG TPA: hypothetical protein VLA19_26785 [Herpetosiphonaceae bacterium]|nr:hypothetical protein [Herpetosiphonaceae bacterium]